MAEPLISKHKMIVTETLVLKHEREVKGYLCKVADETGEHTVLLNVDLSVQACTCDSHVEYAGFWNSCPHMKFMDTPTGYTQVAVRMLPIGFNEIEPSATHKPHIVKIECLKSDDIFGGLGSAFGSDNEGKYYYRLTLAEGKTKEEKNALTQVGRALRYCKRNENLYPRDAIEGSRLQWDLHERIIRRFFHWLSFDEPLDVLLRRAADEYKDKQRKAQQDAWDRYVASGGYKQSLNRTALLVLGLPESATPTEIKSRYRELAKQHHPDVGGDAEQFRGVNEAYQLLMKSMEVSA